MIYLHVLSVWVSLVGVALVDTTLGIVCGSVQEAGLRCELVRASSWLLQSIFHILFRFFREEDRRFLQNMLLQLELFDLRFKPPDFFLLWFELAVTSEVLATLFKLMLFHPATKHQNTYTQAFCRFGTAVSLVQNQAYSV